MIHPPKQDESQISPQGNPFRFRFCVGRFKVNLIAPARGERLIATGKVIKPGRRLVIVTSEVHAEEGDKQSLIALFQGTMVPVTA